MSQLIQCHPRSSPLFLASLPWLPYRLRRFYPGRPCLNLHKRHRIPSLFFGVSRARALDQND